MGVVVVGRRVEWVVIANADVLAVQQPALTRRVQCSTGATRNNGKDRELMRIGRPIDAFCIRMHTDGYRKRRMVLKGGLLFKTTAQTKCRYNEGDPFEAPAN